MPFTTPSDADILASGLAAWLANGIGPLQFDGLPGVVYDATTEWPIYIGPDVPPTPHRLAVVTFVDGPKRGGTVTAYLQIRLRGNVSSTPADDVWQVRAAAQAILDLLLPNGFPVGHVNLGSVRVGTISIVSHGPLGSDDRKRPGYAINVSVRYRKPLPLDGAPPFLPMPEPAQDLTALEQHLADETPHAPYDDTIDLVQAVEEEY